MTEEQYHLAGFRGSLPVLTAKPPHKPWIIKYPLYALICLGIMILLVGLTKAGFGILGFDSIGDTGLKCYLYKPRLLEYYEDSSFKDTEVIYDEDGYPIHPETRERIKMLDKWLLFTMNFFICCVWPYTKLRYGACTNEEDYKGVPQSEPSEGSYAAGEFVDNFEAEHNSDNEEPFDGSKDSVIDLPKFAERTGDRMPSAVKTKIEAQMLELEASNNKNLTSDELSVSVPPDSEPEKPSKFKGAVNKVNFIIPAPKSTSDNPPE